MSELFGRRVRDTITGFTGIAIARIEHMFDTPEIKVQPTELDNGRIVEAAWFTESRIELTENKETIHENRSIR